MRIIGKKCEGIICRELEKQIVGWEEELEKYMDEIEKIRREEEEEKTEADVISDFLEGVLGIRRTQSLVGSKWETDEYVSQVTWGGPNVWICTDGRRGWIEAYWGSEYMKAELSDKASRFLSEVFEYMRELEELG